MTVSIVILLYGSFIALTSSFAFLVNPPLFDVSALIMKVDHQFIFSVNDNLKGPALKELRI